MLYYRQVPNLSQTNLNEIYASQTASIERGGHPAKRKDQGVPQLGQPPAKQIYLPQGSSSSDWQPPSTLGTEHSQTGSLPSCRGGVAS